MFRSGWICILFTLAIGSVASIGHSGALVSTHELHTEGNEGSGGGKVVAIRKHYSVLDLFEAGVDEAPYFTDGKVDPNIRAMVNERLPIRDRSGALHFLVAKKITEIWKVAGQYDLAFHLLETMKSYQWNMINGPLKPIDDIGQTIVDPKALVQAAIRDGQQRISIDKQVWTRMDDANRAALIVHELLYAILPPVIERTGAAPGDVKVYQESSVARRIVGFVFSSDLVKKNWNWLMHLEIMRRHGYSRVPPFQTVWGDRFYRTLGLPQQGYRGVVAAPASALDPSELISIFGESISYYGGEMADPTVPGVAEGICGDVLGNGSRLFISDMSPRFDFNVVARVQDPVTGQLTTIKTVYPTGWVHRTLSSYDELHTESSCVELFKALVLQAPF